MKIKLFISLFLTLSFVLKSNFYFEMNSANAMIISQFPLVLLGILIYYEFHCIRKLMMRMGERMMEGVE